MLSRTILLSKGLGQAWVVSSQRCIFAKIELDGRLMRSLQRKTERLIAIFDDKPHLASSVRLLGFRRFNLDSRPKKEEVYAQIAKGVIQQLPKVETIEFNDIDWRTLSPLLRVFLPHICQPGFSVEPRDMLEGTDKQEYLLWL
ncbi:hypothetical protein BT96DRAFT_1024877 [Gymnopus androsaceus JB14]|uniref:Uncharacterized protein n=1 Tax=Gymnopus androsaceus JB14 TaxID=1447944 RepID=A0A6A4GVL3_9AGAR|nr:hypothetical protein BT96DRAFT_1024877 [Gymnopus androsaceus JB14]